jgi:hypothetical protein
MTRITKLTELTDTQMTPRKMPSAIRSFSGQSAALAEEHLGWDLQEFGRLHSVCAVIQSYYMASGLAVTGIALLRF